MAAVCRMTSGAAAFTSRSVSSDPALRKTPAGTAASSSRPFSSAMIRAPTNPPAPVTSTRFIFIPAFRFPL